MRFFMRHPGVIGALLIASLAFNAGVGVRYGLRTYNGLCGAGTPEHERRPRDPLANLRLTPEQRERFRALRERLISDQSELRAALHDEFSELGALLREAQPDPMEIDQRLKIVAGLRDEMMCGLVDHFGSLRAQLRPDQLPAFEEFTRRVLLGAGMGEHGRERGGGEPEQRSR